jgi:pimeloyl-ACP methyl ester carboxylesterase
MVPVTVDGETVRLAMRVYRPGGDGPFPTLVFNHGSTGTGRDPARFGRPIDFPQLAAFFVSRGWAVVMPARRGRGGSEGEYDEGFDADRKHGYACEAGRAIPGADRALRDIHAAMGTIRDMPLSTARAWRSAGNRAAVFSAWRTRARIPPGSKR